MAYQEPRQLSELLEEVLSQNRSYAERHVEHLKRIGDSLERRQGESNVLGGSESIGLLNQILAQLKLIRAAFPTEVPPSVKTGILGKVKNLF